MTDLSTLIAKLEACPFCGGKGYLMPIRDGARVVCKRGDCCAGGPQRFHAPKHVPSAKVRAIEAWNDQAALKARKESAE